MWPRCFCSPGLAVNSLAAAAFALAGAILAVLTAHLFGAESEMITGGLLGFSPVLTAIALGYRVLSAELAGRGLCCGGHGVHSHCTGSVERCVNALRHSGSDRAFRARDVDIPPSTAVPGAYPIVAAGAETPRTT